MNQAFAKAFLAGLAAPVSLYAPARPYVPPINVMTVAQSFAQVGLLLTAASISIDDDHESDEGS